MTAPGSVRNIFKIALQRVYNFEVDVIAGGANAAAYKIYKMQDYPDLHNSSVVVLLREMQREFNIETLHCRRHTLPSSPTPTCSQTVRSSLSASKTLLLRGSVLSSGKFARLSPGPRSFSADGYGYLHARSVMDRTRLDLPYSETCVAHLRPGDEENTC